MSLISTSKFYPTVAQRSRAVDLWKSHVRWNEGAEPSSSPKSTGRQFKSDQ